MVPPANGDLSSVTPRPKSVEQPLPLARTIDPPSASALHPMLLSLADHTLPTAPATLFGRAAPLVVEIGHGNGSFLEHLAKTRPAWNLLGAETSRGSVTRTFRRLRTIGHPYVRLYRGSGRFVVRNLIPPRAVHRVYVNFPDPWPKERHQHHRLLQRAFFAVLATRLAPGGSLWLTTDHAGYAAFATAAARASGCFAVQTDAAPPEAALRTKYARRWIQQGKTIHHRRCTLRTRPGRSYPPTVTAYPNAMHHAILAGPMPSVDDFEKRVLPFDGGHVILLEAMRSVNDTAVLFLTRVEEDDLIQELLLEVRPHADGIYVGIKPFAQPLSTGGTRAAVRFLTEWLQEDGRPLLTRSF